VWLDGEALCAIPEVAGDLQDERLRLQLYDVCNAGVVFRLPSGRMARLQVRRSRIDLGRLCSLARRRTWRSPELRSARLLFHLERHRLPAPRLLAFGQRTRRLGGTESFVLSEPHAPGATPLLVSCGGIVSRVDNSECGKLRGQVLDSLADLLRRLHDAGCIIERLEPQGEPFAVQTDSGRPTVVLADVARLRYRGRVRPKDVRADLRRLWRLGQGVLARGDATRFLMRYLQVESITPHVQRLLVEV
jgi:hypothetical protein